MASSMSVVALLFVLTMACCAEAFSNPALMRRPGFAFSTTPLQALPKPGEPLFKGANYDQTIEQLMIINNLTEEEAKAEYNAYLDNPNNYALAKVSLKRLPFKAQQKYVDLQHGFVFNMQNEISHFPALCLCCLCPGRSLLSGPWIQIFDGGRGGRS
jgi:hypothetical protein